MTWGDAHIMYTQPKTEGLPADFYSTFLLVPTSTHPRVEREGGGVGNIGLSAQNYK
jgi:hypothetical protein